MNQEKPTPPDQPVETLPVEAERNEAQPGQPQPQDPRRRLRELLAIPDRDRSDAIWDEIISLEIQLAPGNRAPSPSSDPGRRHDPGRRQEPGRRPEHVRRQEPTPGAKPAKRFIKKSRRGPGGPSK